MQKINLYRYTRNDGGISVSPIQPNVSYTTMVRLIADEGKQLTKNNVDFCECVDDESDEGWIEVDAQEEDELEASLEIFDLEVN